MKSVILVTSHLNDKVKTEVAKQQIEHLKEKTNLNVIHVSNFTMSKDIQNLSDYSAIKKNEISNRYSLVWNIINAGEKYQNYKLNRLFNDYGYSHLDLMLFGFRLCQSLNFEYVYHINYDCLFDDENLKKFIENGIEGLNRFYKYKHVNNDLRITTQVFSIRVEDFIHAIQPKLPLYKNSKEDSCLFLKTGWMCEEFFEWVFNTYFGYKIEENFIEYNDVITHNPSWNNFEIEGENFEFFIDRFNNEILYVNTTNNYKFDLIKLQDKSKNFLEIHRYKDNIFYSPIIDGQFFIKDDILIEIEFNNLKNNFFCEII